MIHLGQWSESDPCPGCGVFPRSFAVGATVPGAGSGASVPAEHAVRPFGFAPNLLCLLCLQLFA